MVQTTFYGDEEGEDNMKGPLQYFVLFRVTARTSIFKGLEPFAVVCNLIFFLYVILYLTIHRATW